MGEYYRGKNRVGRIQGGYRVMEKLNCIEKDRAWTRWGFKM